MNTEAKEHRIAILLKSLGDGAADAVLGEIPDNQASSLSLAIKQLNEDPPTDDEVTDVLEEFQRFMEFALANSKELSAARDQASAQEFTQFHSTGDPFEDLINLHDYQIAGALRRETGGTIAIVLSQLPDQRIGEIVRQLPDEVKEDAFLRLQASHQIPKQLLLQVIQSTVDRASLLDQDAASDPDHVAVGRTAGLLRTMDRKTRSQMLLALENAQPEFAEQVKGQLFLFEDLLRFTDKSVQRLLGEVESSQLATVLKNADEEMKGRITSNLSKRAKASLLEEIEFLDSVSAEAEEEAQKALCEVFAKLDQSGDLEMTD